MAMWALFRLSSPSLTPIAGHVGAHELRAHWQAGRISIRPTRHRAKGAAMPRLATAQESGTALHAAHPVAVTGRGVIGERLPAFCAELLWRLKQAGDYLRSGHGASAPAPSVP